jgi:hypothetical protein
MKLKRKYLNMIIENLLYEEVNNPPDKNNPKPFPGESGTYVYYKEGGDWYTQNIKNKRVFKLSGSKYKSTVNKLNAVDWSSSDTQIQKKQSTNQKSKDISKSWEGLEGVYKARGINFHKLEDDNNNYRAGIDSRKMPSISKEFFEELNRDYGITNVITLNRDHNPGTVSAAQDADMNTLEAFTGVGIVNVNGSKIKTLDMDQDTWDEIKSMLDGGNTLIHCTHGADRTGATVARWYIESGNMEVDEALRDAYQYKGGGEKAFYSSMKRFITHGVEGDASKSAAKDNTVY